MQLEANSQYESLMKHLGPALRAIIQEEIGKAGNLVKEKPVPVRKLKRVKVYSGGKEYLLHKDPGIAEIQRRILGVGL